MPEVKCTVSNCQFWEDGNRCVAKQILITAGKADSRDKFGQGAQRMRQTPVQMAEDAFCWSFISRDDDHDMEMEESEEMVGLGHMPIPPII